METPIWNSEKRKVVDLKDWPYNPRKISDSAFKRLVERIQERGFHDVIKIDTHNQILSGNMRRKALASLGIEEVNVLVPNRELTKEEADAVVIESNRNDGEWDFDILANNWDVEELKDLGFTSHELNFFEGEDDGFNIEKEKEKITDVYVKEGEIYQLGNHRIMCGDSTSEEQVQELIGDHTMNLLFTSPPYNMNAGLYGKQYTDDKGREEYIDFNLKVVNTWGGRLQGFIFWNISYNKNARDEFLEVMYKMTKETRMKFLELVVWNKKHALPITSPNMLTRQFESILVVGDEETVKEDIELYFVGSTEQKAVFNKRTKKALTNYWEIDTNNAQIDVNSACFPLDLPLKGINLMTLPGDCVADPFVGSGTTIIACEQSKRKCFGMEQAPLFAQLAIERWERYTEQKAIKLN